MPVTARRAALPLLALLALCAGPPASQAQDAFAGLQAQLDAKLRRLPGKVELGLVVADARSWRVVARRDEAKPLRPASNVKLVTTAAALELLGPDFCHETRLVTQGRPRQGTLPGDLVVIGSGDPTLSRRFDPQPLLSDWADALWRMGIRRVRGDVVACDRAFEQELRLHPSWEAKDAERWYGAEVSALNLNDNCVDVGVAGGARITIKAFPASDYVSFDVAARVTDERRQHVFSLLRQGEDRRTIRVQGKVWRKASGNYQTSVPVRDPALFFVHVLRQRLIERGIEVAGQARRIRSQEQPGPMTLLARKAPLPRTLAVTNKRSQNLYAECLLKTLGARQGSSGSWAAGAEVLTRYAREAGAAAGEVTLLDGSGLSRDNRLSPRALLAVVRRIVASRQGPAWIESLARPGEEGTLQRRLRRLPRGVEVYAKTGTLRRVASLSGVVSNGQRPVLAFVVLVNGPGASRRTIDELVEVMAEAVAREAPATARAESDTTTTTLPASGPRPQ